METIRVGDTSDLRAVIFEKKFTIIYCNNNYGERVVAFSLSLDSSDVSSGKPRRESRGRLVTTITIHVFSAARVVRLKKFGGFPVSSGDCRGW